MRDEGEVTGLGVGACISTCVQGQGPVRSLRLTVRVTEMRSGVDLGGSMFSSDIHE